MFSHLVFKEHFLESEAHLNEFKESKGGGRIFAIDAAQQTYNLGIVAGIAKRDQKATEHGKECTAGNKSGVRSVTEISGIGNVEKDNKKTNSLGNKTEQNDRVATKSIGL